MKKLVLPESAIRPIAERMVQAQTSFIETLSSLGGITKEEAGKVFALYLKRKVIKRDLAMGRYNAVHGAYLDRENIQHALTLA